MMRLMAATGTGALLSRFAGGTALAAEPSIELENPEYKRLYGTVSNYYFNDPQWVKETTPRLTWPQAGEKVPELTVVLPTNEPHWLDAYRKWAADAEQLGIQWNIQQASQARWLELIQAHRHGDIEMHPAILRPERVDPSEWLVSRAYGFD